MHGVLSSKSCNRCCDIKKSKYQKFHMRYQKCLIDLYIYICYNEVKNGVVNNVYA